MRWGNNVENGGISDGHDHWDEPTKILMNIKKVWWVKTTRMIRTLMITIVLTSYLEIGVASSHKHLCGLWLVCTIMHINIKFGGLQSKHCQHLWGAIERKTRKIYRKEITQVTKQWPTSSGIVSYFSSSWEIVLLGKVSWTSFWDPPWGKYSCGSHKYPRGLQISQIPVWWTIIWDTAHTGRKHIFTKILDALYRRHHGCHHQHWAKVTRRCFGAHWARRGGQHNRHHQYCA